MLVNYLFFKSTKSKKKSYSRVKYPRESLLKISDHLKKNLLQKEMGFIMRVYNREAQFTEKNGYLLRGAGLKGQARK